MSAANNTSTAAKLQKLHITRSVRLKTTRDERTDIGVAEFHQMEPLCVIISTKTQLTD